MAGRNPPEPIPLVLKTTEHVRWQDWRTLILKIIYVNAKVCTVRVKSFHSGESKAARVELPESVGFQLKGQAWAPANMPDSTGGCLAEPTFFS